MEFRETGIIVDRVWYSPARLREIVREHDDLHEQLRLTAEAYLLTKDTLQLRSAALDRVIEKYETLKASGRPNP